MDASSPYHTEISNMIEMICAWQQTRVGDSIAEFDPKNLVLQVCPNVYTYIHISLSY